MAGPELSEEKQRARATWDAGDFPAVARLIASGGRARRLAGEADRG